MKISIIGVGYVGLATATVFAELGNDVVGADIDKNKIEKLNQGIMPIFEPGLKELVERNLKEKRLKFTNNNRETIEHGEIIFQRKSDLRHNHCWPTFISPNSICPFEDNMAKIM